MAKAAEQKVLPFRRDSQTRLPFTNAVNQEYTEEREKIVGLLNEIKESVDQIKAVFPNLSPTFVKMSPAKKELDKHLSETVCRDDAGLKPRFQQLVSTWKRDTRLATSVMEMATHPAYQQIIGMGPAVVPLILNRLVAEPDHWFWALKAITGQDPVPPESRGKLDEMTEAWLKWGQRCGIECSESDRKDVSKP